MPRGPLEHESGPDIVTHFFEAMTARPMSATVAREFLTKSAADGWSPEDGYLVYESKTSPEGNIDLKVTLSGVKMFDSRGRWIGTPPGGTRDLSFAMEPLSGEWRIASAPDALMVPANWFAPRPGRCRSTTSTLAARCWFPSRCSSRKAIRWPRCSSRPCSKALPTGGSNGRSCPTARP